MSILWFTVFGNSALWLDTHVANGALSALTNEPEKLLFAFLNYLPWPVVSSLVALLVISLFFYHFCRLGHLCAEQYCFAR